MKRKGFFKNLILVVVSFVIFAGSVPADAAYIPGDVAETEFESSVELLIALGAIDVAEEGLFMPYDRITRAEFATILQRLISPSSEGGETGYTDVADNHYAANAVRFLSEEGYMNGYGNGIFKPDDEIKYAEAVKVVVSIMGCDKMAELNGGFPDGYTKTASELGILRGVSPDGEYINKGNIAKLLVNSFDKNPATIEIKNGRPAYSFDEEYTVLSAICGIYQTEGIIEANEIYGISGLSKAPEGTIIINSDEFLYSGSDDYTGYFADCYYTINDYDEYVVKALIPHKTKNDFVSIASDMIDYADGFVLYYIDTDSDRTRRVKFDGDTVFIYNDKNKQDFALEDLEIENGYIECIDNDGDGVSEVIRIYEYYNMVVESADEEKITDKFDTDGTIVIEDYEKVTILNSGGEEVEPSAVQAGSAASVYKSESDDENVVRIILSERTVSGKVESVFEEDGTRYVRIDGTEYPLYNGYRTYTKDYIELGEEGTFLLDADGKIVTMTGMSYSGFSVGILVSSKNYDDETTGANVLDLKVYTQAGKLENLKAFEKITLDGLKCTSGGTNANNFRSANEILNSVILQPILYKCSGNGNLYMVDTSKAGAGTSQVGDRLAAGTVLSSGRYKSNTKIFEGQLVIDDNTIVFLIPSTAKDADEKDFTCTNSGYFVANQTYSGMTPYNIEDKIPADIVVLQAETSVINNESSVALIKSVGTSLNEDEEEVLDLKVYVDGAEATWQGSSTTTEDVIYKIDKYSRAGDTLSTVPNAKLEKGDLIKCSFDQNGNIDKIALVYDASAGEMISVNAYHNDFHERGERYVCGTADERYEGYVKLIYTDTGGTARTEYHNVSAGSIFKVNLSDKDIMEEVQPSEIKDNKHNQNGTRVIVISDAGTPSTTFIYE